MKKFYVGLVLVLMVIPSVAMAAFFMADENVAQGDVIDGNLYMAGGSPVMGGDVRGDLYVVGGNIVITGNVTNDLVAAGGNVSITGTVGDDLRIFGGQVFIDGPVKGELLAFGGDITVGPKAVIGGDLISGGGSVIVDDSATILGKIMLYTDKTVEAGGEPIVSAGADSTGFWMGVLFTILGYFVIATVIMGLLPNVTTKYLKNATGKGVFWKSLGMGLLIMIVTPICAIICFISGIGVMLGFALLAIYLMYILINLALAGVLFGAICQKYIMKPEAVEMNWLWGLGGVAVLALLSLIPFVGFWIGAIFFLYSLGAISATDWQTFKAVK